MKAYTDLEQSRKLAEILPIESADMYYLYGDKFEIYFGKGFYKEIKDWYKTGQSRPVDIPCWSLAALLNVLPQKYYPIKDHETNLILSKPKDKWCVLYWDAMGMQDGEQTLENNPVDACVNMIIKLHEFKMM